MKSNTFCLYASSNPETKLIPLKDFFSISGLATMSFGNWDTESSGFS